MKIARIDGERKGQTKEEIEQYGGVIRNGEECSR